MSQSNEWQRCRGTLYGHDACTIEDLHLRNLDRGDAIMLFAEPPDVYRATTTPAQAIERILTRARRQGITVEPGEVVIDHQQQWIFRGWRLSRDES